LPTWNVKNGQAGQRPLELSGMRGSLVSSPEVRGALSTHHVKSYQHSASFVPKLAGKIVDWLDVNKDDKILSIGCGGRKRQVSLDTYTHEG
jgi:hypothetical protein